LDVPGFSIDRFVSINHTAEVYDNFYEWVTIDLGQTEQVCSYTNTWNYQARIDVDATDNTVQLNSLSTGLINPLPTNSFYNPPR
jgi:hypothetical protein